IVDRDDGVGLIKGRVPTRNGTVLADKDEEARLGVAIERNLEKGGAIEHDSGRIPAVFVTRRGWNRHNQLNGSAILMVESVNTGPIVTQPNRAVEGDAHAPVVD